MIDARAHVSCGHDIVLLTLDTLRFDVAYAELRAHRTPNLAALLGPGGWELRHSPGSFTYAAHQAFFAGFLPTPAQPGRHPRLFAASFHGSETTVETTCTFETPDIVTGLAARGYHTICIGGVGFFNGQTPLGSVLPSLFAEAHWSPALGVTSPDSARRQFALAAERLAALPDETPAFVFVNLSALHQPNCIFLPGATEDTLDSHAAALRHIDAHLPLLLQATDARPGPTLFIACGDHGTAYGEDGYQGHRLAHPVVWNVPYGEVIRP